MKKIFLALALLLSIASYGQTLTTLDGQVDGSKDYMFYLSAMADSTGSYYSEAIPMGKFGNIPFSSTLPFDGSVKTVSSAGACSLYVVIQGRWKNNATYSDWHDLDTLNASGTETSQMFTEDLAGVSPNQIRIHVDGISGNRADATVRVFFSLKPKGYYIIKP